MEIINELLFNAGKYIASKQKENGSWRIEEIKHNEPMDYQKDIVITSQCVKSLIFTQCKDFFNSIKKGIIFCSECSLDSNDPMIWWVAKSMVLDYTSSEYLMKLKNKCLKIILENQKNGYWYTFPRTFNLTNSYILGCIVNSNYKGKCIENAISWFKNNKASDKIGWGVDGDSENSEITFTSNVINSLISAGEDPLDEYIQKASKLIRESQYNDGGWHSGKLTVHKKTVYATSVALLSLILTSENIYDKKIKKGINYLVNSVNKDGGWPVIKGEKSNFYSTYHALKVLAFYKFLKERWSDNDIKILKKQMKNQRIVAYLFNQFENYLKNNLNNLIYLSVINSKTLGSTRGSIVRRKDIIKILDEEGPKEISEIIDCLKKNEKYYNLNKKSHITLIKSDLQYLEGMNLIFKSRNRFFVLNNNLNVGYTNFSYGSVD